MPWNDYIPLLLISASSGLLVLAAYFYWGLTSPRPGLFVPALAAVGLVSLVLGLHMTLTWPLGTHPTPSKPVAAAAPANPSSAAKPTTEATTTAAVPAFTAPPAHEAEPKPWVNAAFANVCFGEPSLLFGVILLAAALAIARHWPLNGVALLGLVGGIVMIVIGVQIMEEGLTKNPPVTAFAYILTGLIGILALPTVANPTHALRKWTALLTLLASLMWGAMGVVGYWAHVALASQIK